MRDDAMDPRCEKLVALLYGELPEEEARALRKEIAEDPELRAEYEEISAARTLLGEWEVPEKSPHFVFLADEDEQRAALPRGESLLSRLRERFRGLVIATPWAVATAAVLVAFLAWKDFRVDTTDGGLALRFGKPTPAAIQTAENAPAANPAGIAVPASGPAATPVGALEPGRQAVAPSPANDGVYLTKADFNQYSEGMSRALVALLNDYGTRRDKELSDLLQDAFARVANRQSIDYAELRGRIDALQEGVSVQRSVTDSRLDYLMRGGTQGSLTPSGDSSDSVSVKEGAR